MQFLQEIERRFLFNRVHIGMPRATHLDSVHKFSAVLFLHSYGIAGNVRDLAGLG